MINNEINKSNNIVKGAFDKAKQPLIKIGTGLMLIASLHACGYNSLKKQAIEKDKNFAKIENEFNNKWKKFVETKTLDLYPEILADDSIKSIVLFSAPSGPKFSFTYKGENKKDVYVNVNDMENMKVSSEQDGKPTRQNADVSIEEAEKVVSELNMYLK